MNSLIFSGAMICSIAGFSQNAAYEYAAFVQGQDSLHYRILYPKDFKESMQYPLVLFLHGAGERGNDNESQLVHGGSLFADSIESYPAIVIFPQCRPDDFWPVADIEQTGSGRIFNFPLRENPNPGLGMVSALLDSMLLAPYVDKSRIYIGGLSMGAMGTYELVSRKPDIFAAAVAICGGGNEDAATRYAENTPFWIFHGAKDDVVPVSQSEKMAAAITKAGGTPKRTIYPDANHNSWDSAFAEPGLLDWLFSQHK